MYARAMPGGSLFDELAALIDPTPEEATDEPQGIVVGKVNDDGTYEHRPEHYIQADYWKQQYSNVDMQRASPAPDRAMRLSNSIHSLRAMGFEIVYDGFDGTVAEALGLTQPTNYQTPDGLWHIG